MPPTPTPIKILIINPNSTPSMTVALQPLVESLSYSNTLYTFFTAPTSAPPSINNPSDALESAHHCLPALRPLLPSHDAFLVACFSEHPLVERLRVEIGGEGEGEGESGNGQRNGDGDRVRKGNGKPVLGIFEAGISAALQLLGPSEKFGIVSTGRAWEVALREGVERMLGTPTPPSLSAPTLSPKSPNKTPSPNTRFAGVETTGLNATDLHSAPAAEVEAKIKAASRRLVVEGGAKVVVLGCAGMVGMERWVVEEVGSGVRVVGGVKVGIAALQGWVRGGF